MYTESDSAVHQRCKIYQRCLPGSITDLLCFMTGEEWLARTAQLARDTYQKTTAARRVAATSAETVSSESAGPRQKLARRLLLQQLQLLTVDSQEADSALLRKLLRTCLVTVGLMPFLTDGAGSKADSSAEDLVIGTHGRPSNTCQHCVGMTAAGWGFAVGLATVASLHLTAHCAQQENLSSQGRHKLHQLLEVHMRWHAL